MVAKATKTPKCNAAHSRRFPPAPERHEHRRREEQNQVERDKGAPANEPFHFAAEHEEHVHLDREPEQTRGRVDEGVGRQLPHFAAPEDRGAVEDEVRQNGRAAKRAQEADEDGRDGMDRHQQRRDMDRIAADPRDRLVVIGSGDSEHC